MADNEPTTPPEIVATIASIFEARAGFYPAPAYLDGLRVLLAMIRAHPRELTDSPDCAAARAAMRTLAKVMPGLIERSEGLAAEAMSAGLSAWTDRYGAQGRLLLAAIEPFSIGRRDRRGWWHGWARMLQVEVRLIFTRHGLHASFTNEGSAAVGAVQDLLALAGHDADAAAVVDALSY